MIDMWKEVDRLGFRVVFKNHDMVKECIACYNVIMHGKRIRAASWLDIPEGEIWISELYRDFADYILFHELQEIKYRASGYAPERAHLLALKDEYRVFKGDPKWEKLKREINVCPIEVLLNLPGIGRKLAIRIMENRPYSSLGDLKKLRGIGERRYSIIERELWCIEDEVL